jgi:hypothetical protein
METVVPGIGSFSSRRTPGAFGARRHCPAKPPVRRTVVAQLRTRRERGRRRQRCPVQKCAVCLS